jgi:hypothetical protein
MIMANPKPVYRTDGEWVAVLHSGNLFDTMGEWIAWLDGNEVYSLEGEYIGFISEDGRLLRQRVLSYRKRRIAPTEIPPYEPLETVPLPPMFAELSYSIVDVFEEEPDLFTRIHELRPDSGERPLPRLVDAFPELAVQKRLRKVEQELLEEMTYGLVYSYGVSEPPVPVEAMAAKVQPEDAGDVETASPKERQEITEGFIQRLGHSVWAVERGYCGPEGFRPAQVQLAARTLLMPRHMVMRISREARQPSHLAKRFLVPEEMAVLRMHDLE